MKKLLCLLLCLLLTAGVLVACASNDTDKEAGSGTESTTGNNDDNKDDDDDDNSVVAQKSFLYGLSMEGIVLSELDEQGRLINLWELEMDTLEPYSYRGQKNDPTLSFVYGEDGKLTEISELPVIYDAQGNITIREGEDEMAATIEYHPNGSVKSMIASESDESMTMNVVYGFDAQGRLDQVGMEMIVGETTQSMLASCVYEEEKATLTVKEDDTVMGIITLEFNENGKPTKVIVLEEEDEEGEEVSWTWDGDLLTCYTDSYQMGIEGAAPTTYIRKTLHTYDENGNRIKTEEKENDELTGYTTFEYDEDGRLVEAITYDEDDEETECVFYEYDEDGTLLTVTEESEWRTVTYDGEGRRLYSETAYERHVMDALIGYEVFIYENIYDVDENAPYAYYEKETINLCDLDMEVTEVGETKVTFYSEHDEEVDETTGESLNDREARLDSWGNYMDPESNEIYYFQKYLNEDGTLYYYTAAGVKTNVE